MTATVTITRDRDRTRAQFVTSDEALADAGAHLAGLQAVGYTLAPARQRRDPGLVLAATASHPILPRVLVTVTVTDDRQPEDTGRPDWQDDEQTAMRQRRRRDTLDAPDDLPD